MQRALFALALTALCAASAPAWAGADPFLGEVETFAFNFCPAGWAPLNGQLMPINQNQALFALLGTTYGGDGRINFALPTAKVVFTLTQSAPLIQCIALQGIFPTRN
jgi:microcystin-dependent protein